MKKISLNKIIMALMLVVTLAQVALPITANAQENTTRAYDTYTVQHIGTFYHTKTMTSIDPSYAAEGIPANIRTISLTADLTGYLHYDYLTNRYVSASSPTISIGYVGPVALSLQGAQTYYRDNGNSVTFGYSGTLIGYVTSTNGIPCTINYGTISGQFTANK